tara:strand:- start:7019 stop:7324 length:306 start_codon:yes stop_codon:yes gene_type:complete
MELILKTGELNPNLSDTDAKIACANHLVDLWMKVPENLSNLREQKAAYLHDKGWSIGRNLKSECDIPFEAYCMLPQEIKHNQFELMKWVKTYHPYLLFKSM